jgi:hypothetical protein
MPALLKALPILLGICVTLLSMAGTVKSQDAIANWATWLPLWVTDPSARMNVIFGAVIFTTLYAFIVYGFLPHLRRHPAIASAPVHRHTVSVGPAAKATNPINGLVVAGLTTAMIDLNAIKKEDLSSATLAAWQARADKATRLAHANGIWLHNTISNHLSAAQRMADVDELDLVRHRLAQLIEETIAKLK